MKSKEQTDIEAAKFSLGSIKQIWRNSVRLSRMLLKAIPRFFLAALGLNVLLAIFPFLRSGADSLLINQLVHLLGTGVLPHALIAVIIFVVTVRFLQPLLSELELYNDKISGYALEEHFELLLLARRTEIDIGSHEDPKLHDLFQRANENGTWRIRNFSDRQIRLLYNLFQIAIAASVLSIIKWWIFLIILIATIPVLVIETRYGKYVWNIHQGKAEVRRRYWDLRNYLYNITSLTELRLFQNASHFLERIRGLYRQFAAEQIKNERRRIMLALGAICLQQVAIAVALIWYVREALLGQISIGGITFALASIAQLQGALTGFFSSLANQYQDSLFISDVFQILDMPPSLPQPQKAVVLLGDQTPEITFRGVSFSYPDSNNPVLRNINLSIKPGEKLAIIGVNGAGKTTLVKLLCRFYDPRDGTITVDGNDLRDLDLASWYQHLGVLFQDYSNYHFKVKETISVSNPGNGSNLDKIKRVAVAAEADTFIEEWEHQYEQELGRQWKGGVEPSIGQWQKLALARTFYRDPRVLILDEPTSSIDAEAEAKIFEKLEQLPHDRTVILISHRFSTVRHADKIIVLESGTISESGSHEELLALGGTYARLFKLQAKGYK